MGKVVKKAERAVSHAAHGVGSIATDASKETQKSVDWTTDTLGLTNHAEQRKKDNEAKIQANRAEQHAQFAEKQSTNARNYQKSQYQDWKEIYGPIEHQEAAYVARYNGDDITAQHLAQTNQAYQDAQKNLTRALSQRGVGASGLEAQGLTQLANSKANEEANIRMNQDSLASTKRMQFLDLGLGQGTNMLGVLSNVQNNGVNASVNLSGQNNMLAGSLYNNATSIANQNSRNMTQFDTSALKAIGGYMGGKAMAGGSAGGASSMAALA